MFPFMEVVSMVMVSVISAMLNPLFWLVVFIVAVQYRRVENIKEEMFGIKDGNLIREVLQSLAFGVLGGLIGSLRVVFVGVTLTPADLKYLWPLAILLMLINPRFICFAYAGGILSAASLLLGIPKINVAQILALVAILHMVESVLIYLSGHLGAIPAFIKYPDGRVVGGFNLQKFWPIPIAVLLIVEGPVTGGISMPEWWPLIKPGAVETDALVYGLVPVVAGLGYGDLAAARRPEEKSRLSALFLGIYSFILLMLAIFADRLWLLALAGAFFSPLGHELVVQIGRQLEFKGRPRFVTDYLGVGVLDVIPGSPAWKLGLRPGDKVTEVNGKRITSLEMLELELQSSLGLVEVGYLQGEKWYYRRGVVMKPANMQSFGVIAVPEKSEHGYLEVNVTGPLVKWWNKISKKF